MVVIDDIEYLTVDEVCAMLGVKPATIYAYVSRGILQSYKQGIKRQRLYRQDEIERLLTIKPPEPVEVLAPAPVTTPLVVQDANPPAATKSTNLPNASDWIAER